MPSKEVNFICPECGQTILSAVLKVTEYVEIRGVWEDEHGPEFEIGDVLDGNTDDGPYNFECHSCGFTVGHGQAVAYKWLEEHGMLVDELDEVMKRELEKLQNK